MNIALLTIWHERNYGAELQAYATIKILQQLGHNVKMIDIRLSDMYHMALKAKIGNFLSSLGPCYRNFEKFWNRYIPTTRRYHNAEELKQNPPTADVYIVGSDQVWNPEITRAFSDLFFLDFGAYTTRRISYASSFGTDQWNAHSSDEVGQLLKRFSSVSCRENSGVKILKETFGIEATNVLDPTLLFTNYEELTGNIQQQDTLVYYPLSAFPQLSTYSSALADKLSLKVVNASWKTAIYGSAVWDRNPIEGWVRDIAQAKFVITPSFHGLAMSLIHHRQFAVIVQNRNRATRMISLLELLGLQNRIYYSFEDLDKAQPWATPIDYTPVDEKLAQLRADSIDFLTKALAQ